MLGLFVDTVYIGIGSNQGDREKNLREAVHRIKTDEILKSPVCSSIYETEPVGFEEQSWFLNAVIIGECSLEPVALLRYLKTLEKEMGRRKVLRWGPRLIDLDILFYGSIVQKTEGLEIPHPRLHERGFVLVPLCELTPDLTHPLLSDRTVREILAGLGDDSIVRFFTNFDDE